MSWAHQRTRDLADQILDDAQSFRQRFANAADAVRRGGLVFVDGLLDAAWALAEAGRWARARPGRLIAVATAPLVPALAVLIALSARSADEPARGSVLGVRQDAALTAAAHPLREAPASHRPALVPRSSAPSTPLRVKPAAAPRRASTPAPPVAAAQASHAAAEPAPATPAAKAKRPAAPKAPAPSVPAVKKAAVPPRAETKPSATSAPTPPPAAEQPKPPASPVVPVAAGAEDEDGDRGEDPNGRDGKRGHDDERADRGDGDRGGREGHDHDEDDD